MQTVGTRPFLFRLGGAGPGYKAIYMMILAPVLSLVNYDSTQSGVPIWSRKQLNQYGEIFGSVTRNASSQIIAIKGNPFGSVVVSLNYCPSPLQQKHPPTWRRLVNALEYCDLGSHLAPRLKEEHCSCELLYLI